MKRTIFIMLLLWLSFESYAQYHLQWNEHAFLEIPDPPFNGYVARANWNVNNSNLTFKEADEAGAIIYPNHYFEGTSVVTCNYRYEYYRNGRYQSGTAVSSYTISFKSIDAVLDKTEISMNVGETETISASFPGIKYVGDPKMTWVSSDDFIASVSPTTRPTYWSAKVTAKSSGKVKITFDPIIGPSLYCTVNVAYIAPSGMVITPNPLKVTVGKTKTLSASYTPEGASPKKVTWTSENPQIATVSSKGVVKGLKEGETVIKAETDNGIVASSQIIVLPLPTAVSLPSEIEVPVNYSRTLLPEVTPQGSETTFKWSSSDISFATVSSNGLVKGKKEGTARITVTTDNGKTAECEVTVFAPDKEMEYQSIKKRVSAIDSLVKRVFNI